MFKSLINGNLTISAEVTPYADHEKDPHFLVTYTIEVILIIIVTYSRTIEVILWCSCASEKGRVRIAKWSCSLLDQEVKKHTKRPYYFG